MNQNSPSISTCCWLLWQLRPVYVASAVEDKWSDPQCEFLSARHASAVYELFGLDGLAGMETSRLDEPVMTRIGYHVRSGDHDMTQFDWEQYLAFADKHL